MSIPQHSADITATLPDGRVVRGQVYRQLHGADDLLSVWHPRVVWDFVPSLGDTGGQGMDALLRALRGWLDREVPAAERTDDSAVQITWPSHDVAVSPALLGHGMVPTTVLATRPRGAPAPPGSSDVRVRVATMSDVDEAAKLAAEEARFSGLVLGAAPRSNADQLMREHVERSVYFSGRVYLAELDGIAVGVAICGVTDPAHSPTLRRWLPPGQWGYLGQVAVLPDLRGQGVGAALVAGSLRLLEPSVQHGTFLYYDVANPLSSVFWPRRGYRPVQTRWLCRPAACLR